MAARKRIRRKIRRKAPALRHVQAQGPAPSTRGNSTGDLLVGGMMDPIEMAADRMADRALSQRAPAISPLVAPTAAAVHRKCAECTKEEKAKAPLKRVASAAPAVATGAAPAPAPKAAAIAVGAMGAGRQLSLGERSYFEPRFGRDFSQVHVHEGPTAARATRALGARAFARGTDIAFAPGERTLQTMAHELAHVVQNHATPRRAPGLRRLGDPAQLPSGIACPVASSSAHANVVDDFMFGLGGATLTANEKAQVSTIASGFHALPSAPNLRVDGYASTDGADSTNWALSCHRAHAVRNELLTPSDGSPGVSAGNLAMFAQGETSEFSSSLPANRRARVTSNIPFAPASCASGSRVSQASASIQPVTIADDDGTSPISVPSLTQVRDIWGRCCIDITINPTITVNGTRFKEIEDAGSGAAPTAEENDMFALAAESAAIEIFFVDKIRRGSDAGKHVAGGGTTKNSGTTDAKIIVVEGVVPSVVAHELGHAFSVGHRLGTRADGVNTIARPTGSHNRPASEHVSDQICTTARGNGNVTGASSSGRCCRDLS